MRNECNIIRDVLPLYVEDMVSDDTAAFIEEHLRNCAECREELSKLKGSAEIADISKPISTSYVNEAAPLKAVKKRLRRKQILTILLSFIVVSILFATFYYLGFHGLPASQENVIVSTGIEREENSDSAWIIQFESKAGRGLHIKSERNVDGSVINLYVYETIGKNTESDSFSWGYTVLDSDTVPESLDKTIRVIFSDEEITYSMREEGLFDEQ